jgi:hypothetical protein
MPIAAFLEAIVKIPAGQNHEFYYPLHSGNSVRALLMIQCLPWDGSSLREPSMGELGTTTVASSIAFIILSRQ